MRTRNAKINIAVNILLQIITLIYGLLLPKILINSYGSEMNGLLTSIKSIVASLYIVEAGVSLVALSSLYIPLYKNQKKLVNSILSSSNKLLKRSSYFYLFLLGIMIFFYSFTSFSQYSKIQISFLILLIGLSTFLDLFIGAKYTILIRGDNKQYIISLIQIFTNLINVFIVVFAFKYEVNIFLLYISLQASYFIKLLLLYIFVKIYYTYDFNKKAEQYKFSQQKSSFIHQIASIIFLNTDVILITIFFGFNEVSVYSIYMLIYLGITRILSVFTSGLQPGFGQLMGIDSSKKLNQVFNLYEFIYYNFMGVIYVTCLLTILTFMKIYIGTNNDINYQVFMLALLLVMAEFLSKIRVPSSTLVIAGGYFSATKNSALIEMTLNIIFSLIGMHFMGFYGVILGTIVSLLYRGIDYAIFISRKILFRRPIITIFKMVRTIIIFVLSYFIINLFTFKIVDNLIDWIVNATIIFIMSTLLFIFFNFLFSPRETFFSTKQVFNIIRKS